MREISYSNILVPTDGSGHSYRAGEHAVYLAKKTGAKLHILNVVNVDKAFRDGIHYSEEVRELERYGKEATGKIRSLCESSHVPCVEVVARGSPADVILELSEKAGVDCIVMGSIGMSAIEQILIGSVSEKVLRNARCPVMLIRNL